MNRFLDMQSILITGCNRGIGLGLVDALVKQIKPPEIIIATCRNPHKATNLQDLAANHNNVRIIPLDVTNFSSYPTVTKEVDSLIPGGLNVLVNNAGIPGKYSKLGFLDPKHMAEAFNVNTIAPTMLTKASEIRVDKPVGVVKAAVVNMSSILGSIGKNEEGAYYAYRASKAGLNAVTKSLSIDLKAFNIVVTCLHPGWVRTDMGGPKAPLTIEEASLAITKILYGLSAQQNGKFISYDGSEIPW